MALVVNGAQVKPLADLLSDLEAAGVEEIEIDQITSGVLLHGIAVKAWVAGDDEPTLTIVNVNGVAGVWPNDATSPVKLG